MEVKGSNARCWRVVEDATGRSVLRWAESGTEESALERLDTAGLELADEGAVEGGYDPYDSGVFSMKGSAFYNGSHGRRTAFARSQRSG